MVDLAIASNFARDLTREQFEQSRRTQRRAQARGRKTETTQRGARRPARKHDASPAALFATRDDRRRLTAKPIMRVLTRLVQAR